MSGGTIKLGVLACTHACHIEDGIFWIQGTSGASSYAISSRALPLAHAAWHVHHVQCTYCMHDDAGTDYQHVLNRVDSALVCACIYRTALLASFCTGPLDLLVRACCAASGQAWSSHYTHTLCHANADADAIGNTRMGTEGQASVLFSAISTEHQPGPGAIDSRRSGSKWHALYFIGLDLSMVTCAVNVDISVEPLTCTTASIYTSIAALLLCLPMVSGDPAFIINTYSTISASDPGLTYHRCICPCICD